MATILLHPRYRIIAALSLLLATMATARTSAQSYSLTLENAPYADLQGATPAGIAVGDSVHDCFIDIGESFSFFRRPRALRDSLTLRATGYGNLRIDDDTSIIIIDGIFTELVPRDARSGISYLIDGEPGNRVVKVQWKNAGFRKGTPVDSANFQIWLHQKSGVIEIRIGPGSMPTMASTGGWMGAFISPPDFRYMIEKAWIVGNPAKPKFDTRKDFTFDQLTALPLPGTIFRMTPTGSLGVKRSEKPTGALELFPNPALDRATVRIGHPLRAGASASVRDLLGRLVQRVELDPGSPQIDISGLPPGNYLVELVEGNERYAGRIAKR